MLLEIISASDTASVLLRGGCREDKNDAGICRRKQTSQTRGTGVGPGISQGCEIRELRLSQIHFHNTFRLERRFASTFLVRENHDMASTPQPHDYYEILQVSRDADTKAITSSWRRLARDKHPDKSTAKNAKVEFQVVSHISLNLASANLC